MKLGELLISLKLITPVQLEKALQAQRSFGGKLGTNLIELGFLSDSDLAVALSKQLKIPAATSEEFDNVSQMALKTVPVEFVEKYKVVPLSLDQKLKIAICDPAALTALDELRFKMSRPIVPVIAPEIWVVAAMERYYSIPRELRYIAMSESSGEFTGEIVNVIAGVVDMADLMNTVSNNMVQPESNLSLPDYAANLQRCTTPEQVFQNLFSFLAPIFPRMALYSVKKDQVVGRMLNGYPVHLGRFSQVHLPLKAVSIFKQVVESNQEYRGKISRTPEHQVLFGLLDLSPNRSVAIYRILFRNRVIALLLGDPGTDVGPPVPEAGHLVGQACHKAGLMLEVLFLLRQVHSAATVAKGKPSK